MDRNTLIGGSAVILIIVGIALWAGLRPTPAKAPPPGTGASAIANPYVERAAYYTIAANYPTTTPLRCPREITLLLEEMRSLK